MNYHDLKKKVYEAALLALDIYDLMRKSNTENIKTGKSVLYADDVGLFWDSPDDPKYITTGRVTDLNGPKMLYRGKELKIPELGDYEKLIRNQKNIINKLKKATN
jgi:hypothetical protein